MQYDHLKSILRGVLAPHHFFVAPGGTLRVEFVPQQQIPWELHEGQLLPPTIIRQRRCFAAWNVWFSYPPSDEAPSDEAPSAGHKAADGPVLSVCYDAHQRQLHVVRGFAIYGQEAYEQEPNVIATREVQLWMRELVSTIDPQADNLPELLCHALFRATIGTSRLAITSLESPLPDFSLGRLAYLPTTQPTLSATGPVQPVGGPPLERPGELIDRIAAADSSDLVAVKSLEFSLRASTADEVESLADQLWTRWRGFDRSTDALGRLVRRVFNEAVLAPHTDFGRHLVRFVQALGRLPRFDPMAEIDWFGYMLRQLTRHLTAYDLQLFHNFGANYPDAFLLDDLLKAYLRCIAQCPEAFLPRRQASAPRARRRRRALRQAWVLRKTYELHPVPDQPCSLGDRLRVLPPPYQRPPEEQLTSPGKRRRRLFENDPLCVEPDTPQAAVLRASFDDLACDAELRELGTAIYLDRPLGWFQPATATDRTLLFSYEAFSRRIAQKRLHALAESWHLIDPQTLEQHTDRLESLPTPGMPAAGYREPPREGVVCLEDACRAADDFCFVRSTRSSLDQLLAAYDFAPLEAHWPDIVAWLRTATDILCIRIPRSAPDDPLLLTAFNGQGQRQLELQLSGSDDQPVEYIEHASQHWLKSGLLVRGVAQPTGQMLDVRSRQIYLRPRLTPPPS